MSRIISENQNAWGKKSWLNNFCNDKIISANLTEEYAHDVLEAVGEDYFPTLDAAIADLSLRTGLTASEVGEIKRVCIAMVDNSNTSNTTNCECSCEKIEDIPGNKDVSGDRLVKEGPDAVASITPDVSAKGMNPGFRKYLDEQKLKREKESKKEEKETSIVPDKTAWFQGANEPSAEGDITSNDPSKLGYPREIAYDKKPMETSAPNGQDSRPWEQRWFEDSADETKKVMGPKGKEFEVKIEMQRIPKGEKPANATAKRMSVIKEIVASEKRTLKKKANSHLEQVQIGLDNAGKYRTLDTERIIQDGDIVWKLEDDFDSIYFDNKEEGLDYCKEIELNEV